MGFWSLWFLRLDLIRQRDRFTSCDSPGTKVPAQLSSPPDHPEDDGLLINVAIRAKQSRIGEQCVSRRQDPVRTMNMAASKKPGPHAIYRVEQLLIAGVKS